MIVIEKKRNDIDALNKENTTVTAWDWIKDILFILVLVSVSLVVFYTVQS
ncbi:MAG: hypothetical protein PHC45_10845 [Clostridiaceae bacterium]|nr:hypothetical protein [Clostridiaceae bacterium]